VHIGDDLSGRVSLLADAVADKYEVGDAHEVAVDAVGVHVELLARLEVGEAGEDRASVVSRQRGATAIICRAESEYSGRDGCGCDRN
jgi:hypothetical protein